MKIVPILAIVITVGLLVLFAFGLMQGHEAVKPDIKLTLPSLSLPKLSGGEQKLDGLKGHAFVLNIFATWCPGCMAEYDALLTLKAKNLLPIYGIAWKDKPEALNKLLAEKGNPYAEILLDDEGRLVVDLGATGAPETYLVNAKGEITYRYPGILDEKMMETELIPAMKAAKNAP